MTLKRYFLEIAKYPVLSKKDTNALVRKAQKGDINARNKLIEHNLRFVAYIAKRYSHINIPKIDIIAEGNFGLFEAVRDFDTKSKYSFTTYAFHKIRSHINRYIENNKTMVRVPIHLQAKLKNVYKKIEQGKGLTRKDHSILDRATIEVVSLDNHVIEKGSCHEIVADTTLNPVEKDNLIDAEYYLKKIKTERSRKILRMRFFEDATLEEIGQETNISRERVRQIINKEIHYLSKKKLIFTLKKNIL